ncbi:ABC transporter ATP-binding protein [Nitrosomonas sp.]|uniref:ABC transporter ATP-binding protein n=1 Tax=Nitrosomonas sp. TaxID=42353 RepID=UPI0027284BB5|nr:ABC transporter ATP-binding protein [Nitrosomonas sp.]MDO8895634.1 ABC transporter ATP-binding protein [Nitrosomonas sp.]
MANAVIGLYSAPARPDLVNLGALDNGKAGAVNSPIIQCQQLSHAYSGKAALTHVSFELNAGEPIGLVGPNGAGKTTLLSILSGFLHPASGTVRVFGHPPGAAQLIGKVSALPQDARLDPSFTLTEQLVFYARLQGFTHQQANLEASRVLEIFSLKDAAHEKPLALSHGMAKRVAIAQALIGKPALILLDEPTAGLDPVNVRTVRSIIAELSSVTTFIISSHDLAELDRLCQQILLLENGMLQTEKVSANQQQTASRFITLQMENCPAAEVIAKFIVLEGVLQVTNPQKNEFIVEYNPDLQPSMDLQLMQCMQTNHWQYRQLSHGKTLEEKLFSRNS